jgi:hypothetical protein
MESRIGFHERRTTHRSHLVLKFLPSALLLAMSATGAFAQVDQGAVTGVVQDATGAVIPNAAVTLTDTDTGLTLKSTTDGSGNYFFSPIKIGNYKLEVTAPGFGTTTQDNITVHVQDRLDIPVKLNAGGSNESVIVSSAPPLMQTEDGSTGQVIDTKTINNTPLNGRNWVYIAQLSAGVAPSNGSRGGGKGDFSANGQRSEQNNFVLDGIDNNTNVVDFLNGASFVVRPPPDALAEFKVQTGAYSAEFGHSAGAVVNASIKSGTNAIHGDLWEYIRNDAFDIRQYFDGTNPVPKYRQNQFGATLGFPIIKDKLFLFGDLEANRIIFAESHTNLSVPTVLERSGDFSQLLTGSNNSGGAPITLYQPNPVANGTTPLTYNGQANVINPTQIDPVAQRLLNLFPLPNNGTANQTYNNYNIQSNAIDNTFQWDLRADYNISAKDQIFARHSYLHEPGKHVAPLGPILDGGGFGDTGSIVNLGQQFALSETHIFSPTLTNEFRFGYTYGHFAYLHENANNAGLASSLGLGGIPTATNNDGLPYFNVSGLSVFGSPQFYASNEYQNTYQILDNVSKTIGNHSLKAGVSFQRIRFSTAQPTQPRGTYNFTGVYTSQSGVANTGYGVADFLLNQMNTSAISNVFNTDDVHWDRAGYAQDDWKASEKLTVNLGVRYEYTQPYYDRHGNQALFYPTAPLVASEGRGNYVIPEKNRNVPLSPIFTNLLAKDNITLQYSSNNSLVNAQKSNVAPRFGFAYTPNAKSVIRGGYGIFFGGLESTGYFPNLGENYPFEFDSGFNPVSGCTAGGTCPTNGITLETGFQNAIAAGLQNAIQTPNLRGSEPNVKTSNTQSFNLTYEYSINSNTVASIGYVGALGHHLAIFPNENGQTVLVKNGSVTGNSNPYQPFPDFGVTYSAYDGASNYNSVQTKLERRLSNGLSFLATYTYAHSLDDAPTPLGSTGDSGFRNTNLVPEGYDYASSPFDIRQRFTLNGNYQLPFGHGRQYLNTGKLADYAVGGWSTSLVFRAQTGEPFTVGTSNITTPSGASAHAILIADPFKGGGTFDPAVTANAIANGGTAPVCPTKVRNTANWYNPCAFRNPQADNLVAGQTVGFPQALAYLGSSRNQINAPGYERIDMSLFKSFPTFREQNLEFRADAFNLLNTPAYGTPSTADDSPNGGLITAARSFQNFTPDSRFFQFALKYNF